MKLPLVPNRFQHFSPDFRAVSEPPPCRNQHREFPFHANQATRLPMLERLGGAALCTTNASLQCETAQRIHSVASFLAGAVVDSPFRKMYRTTYCGVPV